MTIPFIPTETFEAEVNGCLNNYREGEIYYCREGEIYDDLRKKLKKWVREKKVRTGPDVVAEANALAAARGELAAAGEVTD